jgi:tRNA modification GTPase
MQADTISAIATAIGEGGIGIIRISGEKALEIAAKIFRPQSGKSPEEISSHQAVYGMITAEDGMIIDEAICLIMRAPHSYTVEDVVELQCHGGTMPLRQALELTYRAGARPAEPGEFTKRAFLNGRLDLTQAQAVMDVITSKTEASLRMAESHLAGKFSKKIDAMRHDILAMIAHLEASIDFPEDDIDDVVTEEVRSRIEIIRSQISGLLATAKTGKILRDGLETAIIGKPNVGKSSLLNALLQETRAIVTNVPGTTRDSIEEYANIGGIPLRIIDTAGIRDTDDFVEKLGVDKARAYIEHASLVLVLFDFSREISSEDEDIIKLVKDKEALILINKTDLKGYLSVAKIREKLPLHKFIEISTVEETGLDQLRTAITDMVYSDQVQQGESAFVNNAREANILHVADTHLKEALMTIEHEMSADFVVIDLRSAWEKLGEITGDTVGEDIIDEIFSQFCIGK